MRVITGEARGRKLKTLEGLDTRPTTDRVKESIFNIIQFDVPGRRILDLFGGSGQMAIEALSRGADSAVIVDASLAATKIITDNVKSCGFSDKAKVVCTDFANYLTTCGETFDVIFLDPPYNGNFMNQAINAICNIDILSDGGIIVCESMRETVLPETNSPYIKGREYLYGKSKITVYRKEMR
ncbi:MAG: 16S rRNA (guanine(966)-N(2))-methyltransferase RsmD [Clostridia bacterium]|nr:16S rRNA (guanine(966)-N(2))-methyltransferase RsmD [Clostridia bacterium]